MGLFQPFFFPDLLTKQIFWAMIAIIVMIAPYIASFS